MIQTDPALGLCSQRCFEDALAAKSYLEEVAPLGKLCSAAAGTAVRWLKLSLALLLALLLSNGQTTFAGTHISTFPTSIDCGEGFIMIHGETGSDESQVISSALVNCR
jgi:hypothetical protein